MLTRQKRLPNYFQNVWTPQIEITPSATSGILQEFSENPRVLCKALMAFLALPITRVHEASIRRTLNNNDVHGRVARRKLQLSNRSIAAHAPFVKDHLGKPSGYWKNVLQTDETKIYFFCLNEKCYVWQKANTAFQSKKLTCVHVKYDDGRIVVWACFAASGPGLFAIIDGILNCSNKLQKKMSGSLN